MPNVSVKFYGFLRSVVHETSTELSISEGSTVADLMQVLGERYGERFKQQVLTRQGGFQDYVRVFVDDDLLEDGKLDATLEARAGGNTRVVVYLLPAEIGG